MATPNPPNDSVPAKVELSENSETGVSDRILDSITNSKFGEWYREKQRTDNIREGKSFFNGPPSIPDPERHKPSLLLRCHRYAFYKRGNAPKESKSPDGLIWYGSQFEEQVTVPFLQDVTRMMFMCELDLDEFHHPREGDELVIKGVTDPAISVVSRLFTDNTRGVGQLERASILVTRRVHSSTGVTLF